MNFLIIFTADYAIFLLFAALPLLWLVKKREMSLHAFLSALSAWLISKFFKDFFYTPRPFLISGNTPLVNYSSDGSFPSNHTAAAFAIAVTVFLHHRRLGSVLIILALLIGVSRIFGGVHYPVDIIGGAVIGSLIAWSVSHLHPSWILKRLRS